MMKKVWLVLLAVVLVFGLVLSCGGGGDDPPPPPPGEKFEFDGPWDGIIKPYGTAPEITGNQVKITGGSNTGFSIDFADIGYTFNEGDILIFTYEIVSIDTPVAVLTVKNPKNFGGNFNGVAGADWGIGKGCEYVLGDETKSNYDGPLVKGTYDAATKVGTFEVMAVLLKGNGATGVGFQHNYWANFGSGDVAKESVYTIKILKIENAVSENVWECDCEGDKTACQCGAACDCDVCEVPEVEGFPPTIKNAEKFDDDGNGQWAINEKLPFKYFVIATVNGGTNADGFGGVQFQLQGGGVTGEIRTTGNWTSLAHTETDVVYMIIDLSGYDNYDGVITEPGWKQFRINYGGNVLGQYQGYVVANSIQSLTKPADASTDFASDGTHGALSGYLTKTLPAELK